MAKRRKRKAKRSGGYSGGGKTFYCGSEWPRGQALHSRCRPFPFKDALTGRTVKDKVRAPNELTASAQYNRKRAGRFYQELDKCMCGGNGERAYSDRRAVCDDWRTVYGKDWVERKRWSNNAGPTPQRTACYEKLKHIPLR